jgi:hypothetical protein
VRKLKRKIFVIVCTLLIILTSVTISSDIIVEADDDLSCNDPNLDHTYIYLRTQDLANLIKEQEYSWRSREFGEPGERKGANDIKVWMEDLNLYNPHLEEIDEEWTL